MRFVCGPIPPSQAFDPAERGWIKLGGDDAEARRFATVASLLTAPLLVAALWLLLSSRAEVRAFLLSHPLYGCAYLLLLIGLIPIHELIHAVAYLKGLRSSTLLMGMWLRRAMFYVLCDAPLPRYRVLLMSVMPFVVLTLVPALVLPWLELPRELRVLAWFFVLLHASICTGDFLVWWRLGVRVPRGAWIHNNGWTTYWTTRHTGPL